MIKDISYGGLFREFRLKNKKTLRQAAQILEVDPGNLSRVERSLLGPPTNHSRIWDDCKALGLDVTKLIGSALADAVNSKKCPCCGKELPIKRKASKYNSGI